MSSADITYGGELALVKPTETGFDVNGKIQIGIKRSDHYAHPVIHNGRLYIRYTNNLWVYDISKS